MSRVGFAAIDLPRDQISEVGGSTRPPPFDVPTFRAIEDLRSWRPQGIDLGEAVLSTIVTVLRDPAPDLSLHGPLVDATVASAVVVYQDVAEELRRRRPDLAYIFNGRFATTRPAIRACERAGVRFFTHEMGYELGTYRLIPGAMVHDLDVSQRQISHLWHNSGLEPEERRRLATSFFEGRRHSGDGAPMEHLRYNDHQAAGQLPSDLDDHAFNVVIFNSSEDEFTAISGHENPVYRDQVDALDSIVHDPRLAVVRIYVRVHPNLMGLRTSQTERLDALRTLPNVTVIDASDPVDTYALMDAATVVVTFGSTVGIEAIHAGVPTVLVGRTAYESLAEVRPQTHDEVISAILEARPPRDPDVALRYGFYVRRGNIPFEIFDQTERERGRIHGKQLRPSQPTYWIRDAFVRARGFRQHISGMLRPNQGNGR